MDAVSTSETSINICLWDYMAQHPRRQSSSWITKLEIINNGVWLVAFTATLYNKIFPGYQPCQLAKRWKKQRFKDHLCPRLKYPEDEDRDGPWNVDFFAA
jgi:hypothetical protein